MCALCTGLLRFYGARGSHQPKMGLKNNYGSQSVSKNSDLLRINVSSFHAGGTNIASDFEEPYERALRSFINIEQSILPVDAVLRKVSGLRGEHITSDDLKQKLYSDQDYSNGMLRKKISKELRLKIDTILEVLKIGALRGHSPSQNLLGSMYLYGLGTPQFEVHGLELVRRAAESGNASAQMNLARLYLQGHKAVHRDVGQAARLLSLAANQGHTEAQRTLGHLYYNGIGVVENLFKAAEYWEKAVESSDADAQFNLGLLYSVGKGRPKDEGKTKQLWEMAVKSGSCEAAFHLGSLLERKACQFHDGDINAFLMYKAAADCGHGMAQYHIGVMYLEGRGNQQQSDIRAFEFFEKASQNGIPRAQLNLGILILEGRGGADLRDTADERARALFTSASEQGLAEAKCCLAWMFLNGRGIGSTNDSLSKGGKTAYKQYEAKALELYRSAAEQGIAEAFFHLGLMYFKGIGVEKDEKRGTEFIIQAASKGHQEAQYELGLMRILLCSNATYRSRSMKDFIHNEANLSDGSIQHSELLSPPPPPPPPPGSPEEVKTLISATVKESRAIVASNWREEENNIAEVLKIAHVAVEKHDEEESDSIEDWLNTIEDGYGNMYHMVFLSSGYETLQKLERDCGKAEVVQFLLQKLKSKFVYLSLHHGTMS